MTFEQIAYFLALAAEGNFARAARRSGISQPSLTNAIKSLEIVFGARLFDRTSTGSELTSFGRQMYPRLARIHSNKILALKFARKFESTANQMTSTPPRLAAFKTPPGQSGELRKSHRRTVTVAIGALLACLIVATGRCAYAEDAPHPRHKKTQEGLAAVSLKLVDVFSEIEPPSRSQK